MIDGCGREPFHVYTNFVKNFMREFSSPESNTRVGVILYSRKAKFLFGFNYFKKAEDSFDALNRIRFTSKETGKPENIGAAMTKAHDMLFRGSRMGIRKVLVVTTAARANDDIINPSNRLRKDGVVIYAVGFGKDFDRSQLEMIASKPVREHVFSEDPHQSSEMIGVLRNHLCQGKRWTDEVFLYASLETKLTSQSVNREQRIVTFS